MATIRQVRILDPAPVSYMLTKNKKYIDAKARAKVLKIIRTYNNEMNTAFKNYEKACSKAVEKLERDIKVVKFK